MNKKIYLLLLILLIPINVTAFYDGFESGTDTDGWYVRPSFGGAYGYVLAGFPSLCHSGNNCAVSRTSFAGANYWDRTLEKNIPSEAKFNLNISVDPPTLSNYHTIYIRDIVNSTVGSCRIYGSTNAVQCLNGTSYISITGGIAGYNSFRFYFNGYDASLNNYTYNVYLNGVDKGDFLYNSRNSLNNFEIYAPSGSSTDWKFDEVYYSIADSYFNLTAFDNSSNNYLTNFTAKVYNEANILLFENSTTNGEILFNMTNQSLNNYSVYFENDNHKNVNTTLEFLDYSLDYTFLTNNAPSINITILKESDGTPILEPVTVRFTDSLTNVFQNITSTSLLYNEYFPPDNYLITFISENYTNRNYIIDLYSNDIVNLNAYLIGNGESSTILTFKDKGSGALIEGVILTVETLVNSSWVVVSSTTSDITGKISFDYVAGSTYRFSTSKTGYEVKSFILNPILYSEYTIKLITDGEGADYWDYSGINIVLDVPTFHNNAINNVSVSFSSPYGEYISYMYNITGGAGYETISGVNPYGETLFIPFNLTGANFNDRIIIKYSYTLANGNSKHYTRTYTILDAGTEHTLEDDNHYGLGILERVLIVTFSVILVVGMATMFGGALAGGLMALLMYGFFIKTGFIEVWVVVISLIMLTIILMSRSSQ